MKKISLLAIIVLFSIYTNAQKTVLKNSEVPAEISKYIVQNFKNIGIKKAIKDVDDNETTYELFLSNKMELEFDETFKIKEIEAKKGIPLNLIPLPIANYVQNHYPDLKVVEWKRNNKGQKIELKSNVKIRFDNDGNFIQKEID